MGLFDRKPADKAEPAAVAAGAEKTSAAGGVLPQLAAAREKLKAKDVAGAVAIYENVLADAGDRADVLVTISGDLGATGHVKELIELLAPRYDADRHGAAAGINLLQAYLVTRNADAAQHLLDLLFSLRRPELEARLVGFSNAVAELFVSENEAADIPMAEAEAKIALVSIGKPMWFYGLETLAPHLLPRKEGRLRRVAFAQLALPGIDNPGGRAAQPEDALARLTRGLPLWLGETFAASAGYESMAAVAASDRRHYAVFPVDWVAENIRQLNDTTEGGLDYVVTGALRNRNDDYELSLRIWEVKKYRELKVFATRFTPSDADAELNKFQEVIRGYMEWTALPGNGLAYAAPAAPFAYIQGLGSALTLFLGEKGVLAPEQAGPNTDVLLASARANPDDARAQLALVAAVLRLKAQGISPDVAAFQHVSAWLASPGAQAADAAALVMKLA